MKGHETIGIGRENGLAVVQRRESDGTPAWWCFREPDSILLADSTGDLCGILKEVERQTLAGKIAVGFLSYEAAPGLDATLTTLDPGPLPIAYFAIYSGGERIHDPGLPPLPKRPPECRWSATMDAARHGRAVGRIRKWIAEGETYQVNLTYRLQSSFREDPWTLFCHLVAAQRARYSAYLDLGDHVVASVSPELFFRLEGDRLETRPMKGTAARGRTTAEDELRSRELRGSAKQRAENLMIVDMLRNDLGKVARPGSVQVENLFEVERYPSVLQLTSTVTAESEAGPTEVLTALFPSASITGAPKVRAMQLIAEVEQEPRGIYTGAIGTFGPGRRAEMNVAIRTLHVDRTRGFAEYGTGGGIVWDSDAAEEYRETLTKALVLTHGEGRPTLLETLGFFPGEGYRLLDRHLRRVLDSAEYFDIPVRRGALERTLQERSRFFEEGNWRVRLLVAPDGSLEVEAWPLEDESGPWTVAIAAAPIDSSNPYLFHKTTRRQVYEEARRSVGKVHDVLLWNEDGQATELTVGNLVVEVHGVKKTPPLSCGLLAGTMRGSLVESGEIVETVVELEEVRGILAGPTPGKAWLVNSVRGWVELVGECERGPEEAEEPQGLLSP